jgi:diguanylate cyclase (GGDEF)-like protein/PAS domain S-box-containing protein
MCGLFIGLASAVLVVQWLDSSRSPADHWPSPTYAAGATVVIGAILIALHLRPRRNVAAINIVESIQLDEVLVVPAFLILLPWQSIGVVALASLVGSISARRDWVKIVFNLGQVSFAATAGLLVVHLLGATPTSKPEVPDALAGMVGALTFTAVSAVSVRIIVSYASGSPLLPLLKEIPDRFVPWLGAVMVGGVGAVAVGAQPWSALLVLGVVAFVHRAYAASLTEQAARRQSERLQEAIVSLRSLTDPDSVRNSLLGAARNLLGAGTAEIASADKPAARASLTAPLYQEQVLRVANRRGSDQWDDRDRNTLLTLGGVAGDVLRSAELITRLRTITDSQTEAVIALDLDAHITFVNPAAVQMLGANSADDLVGAPVQDRLPLRQRRQPLDFATMVAEQVVAHDADGSLGPPTGETLDIAYSMTPLRAEAVHVGAVLVLRDVTERRKFKDELTRRALHDELTGLPNRRLLTERLGHALSRSTSTGREHGLLYLDLDRFKVVNDSYGHLVGDRLLVQVANRLRDAVSTADTLARLSGDEFVVLVEDADDMDKVTAVADELLNVLQKPFEIDTHHIFMSASIGVGLTRPGDDRDGALALVAAAAYSAKAGGRNCYCTTSDASVDQTRARLELEVSLRQGLDENELELHYQPIVTTDKEEIVGVEALLRWRSPRRGMLAPHQFVPLAEETGLIVPMGRWVLEEACRALQKWTVTHQDRRPLTVSVNLSALQFSQHRLLEDVSNTLESTGLPASQLCLEITETVLMTDTSATKATLDALHGLGVRVAIDDFGTGYSSLSYLKRFPIDVVKLDRTFVQGVVSDAVDTEIAKAVVGLSKALKMTTVAEGVETDTQRQILVELGCPLMQGYLTARPLPADDFLEFWDQRASLDATVADLEQHRSMRRYQRRGLAES